MASTPNLWHFARPALAADYLHSLELGLSSARGLFAKRRMGKTEFLVQDFMPAATAAGYVCAYVNLWELKTDPATAVVAALYKAIAPKSAAQHLASLFQIDVKKVKGSVKVSGMAEGGIEAELAERKGLVGTLLMQAMEAFDKSRKKMVLIIDEAQVLAQEGNSDFTHALRAALDNRKDKLKVLFAGSSEPTLRRMFSRPSEPFYNWTSLEPFPLLGTDFVSAMVVKVSAITKKKLTLTDANKAFEALNRTPLFFREFLDRFLTGQEPGIAIPLNTVLATIRNDAGSAKLWEELLPMDRLLLQWIAKGAKELVSETTRQTLAQSLGLDKPVTQATVQNALRRLMDRSIITRMDRGIYQFEDDAFVEWVRYKE